MSDQRQDKPKRKKEKKEEKYPLVQVLLGIAIIPARRRRVFIGHSLVPPIPATHGQCDARICVKKGLEILRSEIDIGSWVVAVCIYAFFLG